MALQSYFRIAILQHTARIFLGIAGLLLYAANANTQTVPPLESDTPSDFRRIFVPANNPELWPQGDTRYLPIQREAFEALVSKSKKLDDTAQNSHAVISTARYSASLEKNQLKGTAELGIEHRGGTKVLTLSPWNMVISSVSWRAQTDIPVQLGIWGDTSARGTYGVKVEQSDELLLEWDLKAHRMNANSTVYRLHTPPTAQCTFELTLPHDATASMSSAVVVSKMNLALNRQRLTFQLTNADSHLLRITTTAESENTSLPPQISQDTTYRIEKKGTSVVTKIRLEDSTAAQKELRIHIPQDTHLTNVKIDGIKTAWTQSISPEGEVIAIVNRPLLQHPQSIELHAFARTLMDQSWLVPRLHFENVSWTQGSTILLIAPELELQSFSPSNAILEHIVGLNSPTGEAFRFQDLSGESQIECLLGPSVPKLEIHFACSLSWEQSHIVAEQNTSLTTTQGSLFHLEFDISPNWKIESVESLSPAVIENWQIREEAGQKVLHIQLESPVTPSRATTLKIFGRAATDDFSFPTQAAKLSPVIFTSSELKQSYLQLPQKQLSRKELVMASDLAGQEIASFDDSIAELFTDPTGQAYEIQHNSKEARVNLQKRHSSFKAEIYVEANAKESVLEQNFTVNIEPTAGIVSDVVLESTMPLPVGMAWSLINQSGDAINRVLMSSNHTSSDQGTYRYTLRLPNVQEEAFQLRGETSIAIQNSQQINLLQPQDAEQWGGIVSLRGTHGRWQISDSDWVPAIAPISEASQSSDPLLACFRYGPESFPHSFSLTKLDSANFENQKDAISATAAEYDMWQSEQGIAIVRATYNLVCKGAGKISFKFPSTAHFESCYLNSKQITANRNEENPDRLWISVPYNSSKQILSLNYKVNGPVAAGPTKTKLLLPECSFQVQHHRWNLYTSPNLVVEQAETLKADQSLYWWQRLFGPIARHPQSHIFNPTKQVHWQQLWASLEKRRPGFKKTQRTLTNTEYGISPGDLNSDTDTVNDHDSYFMGNKWSTEFLADPPTVIIAKRNQSNALWYVIWFLTLATGSWLISNRATFVMVLTAAFSIACLLAPTSWLTIFQAAFLGLLAAMALHLLLMILVKDQSSDANLENTAAKSAFSLLLIISFDLQGTCSLAEDSVPKLKPDIPKVFFPIDRSGALQGDDVFVDEVYLKQLKQVSETNFSSHADYLIHEIRYSGALTRQTTVQGQDVTKTGSEDSPWSIQISVESFRNDVALELPLSQEDAKWLAGTHLLDGAPISIEWGQSEGTCKVKMPKSGYHRLELFFHPQVTSLEERNLINMRVPSFPAARLGLSTDSSLVDLQIENSIPKGKVSTSSFHEFDLGPQDLLHISWKPETSRNISPWNGNLDLLSWLHIEPARARLHVQAVCKHSGKGTCEFELSYPAQLKHIAEDADHDNYRIEAIETDNRILIKADTNIDGEVRIPLEFEFKRSVSLGEIYFPIIQTNNPSPSRSLFAVSVDSRLSYSEKSGINLQGITPGEFAEGWDSTDELPLFAYSLGSPEADWSIQVWPAPISYTAQQRLEVLCQPEKAQLAYEANIENLTSELLVHRLRVPPNLELKSLVLINQVDKETIPTRWSRITQDEVFIFLDRPLQQPHKLSLVGTVPLETPGKFVPPYMGLLAAERNKIRLELLRTRDVLVNWTNPDQAPEELPIQASTRSSDEIPIGVYSWSSDGLELNRTLNIHENDARIESESCLEIEKTEVNAWQATLHAMVKVKSGVVDRLRVSVPDSLSENFRLLREQTGVLIKSNSSVDKDIVTLLLSKPLEAGEVLDFHLTSELEVPVNQQVSIPDIKLLDSTAEEKYLVLPTQSAGESIAWHRPRGLRKRRIPKHILKMIDSEVAKLQFQIDSDTFSISQRSQRGSLNKAAIRNMDVVGSLDLHGNLSMVAHVILQPGRATSCSIRFPDHSQVTGIKVDGFFVRGQKRKDGTWSIPVGPPYLPREISLSYSISNRDQGSDTEVLLPAPRILLGKQELPLPLVFWQIRPLGEVRFANKISGNRISAKDFALHRHDALLSTLEIAYPQLMSLSSFESASWLSSWLNKIEQSSSIVETSKSATLDNNLIPSNSNPVYDDQAQQELLDLVNSYMESLEFIPNVSPENSGVIQDALKSEDKFFTSNENGEIILSIHRGEYPSKERWLASLAILALSLIGLRTRISTASWTQTTKKYPYLLAFLVGLTWWLCFRPSAFGLVLMGIVLAAKIKTRLHDYQKQRDQSISTQIAARTT